MKKLSLGLTILSFSCVACLGGHIEEKPQGSAPGTAPSIPAAAPTTLPAETTPTTLPMRATSHLGARVFIVEPLNGADVTSSPVTVKFGADAIAVEPAGSVKDNSGHHHLLVDVDALPAMDQPLPFSDHVLHFGQAQKEAVVNLTPGKHTLQLVLAGGNHIPHNPPVVSEKITITVK